MLRTAFLRSARCLKTPTPTRVFSAPVASRLSTSRITKPQYAIALTRCYSAHAGLAKDEVQGRILDLLKNFDKVKDVSKLQSDAHFANDLGLDSLDTVEVVMAIEEEFSIEIPDKEADAIHSVKQAVEYILNQPDAH